MTDPIRMFFQRQMGLRPRPADAVSARDPQADERRRLHVAACALLLELAHADEEFTDEERTHIEAVMRRHFDLDEDTAQELIALAQLERSEAIDLYQFTRQVREQYDLGQKTLLAEIMWGIVMNDGVIAQSEAHMLRKIANLLDLKPGYLSEARRRAGGESAS